MADLTNWLFHPDGLTAHGFCLLWEPWLIWTHAAADAGIGIAYFTIPVAMAVYVRRRRDLAFRPVFWLFATFILLCGTGHWLDLLTLWIPAYRLEALVKATTALVSIATAISLWLLLPRALALPSPQQMQRAHAALRESEDRVSSVTRSLDRLASLVEASPAALVLCGPAGQIKMLNATAEAMFGYARAELEDHSVDQLLPGAFPAGEDGADGATNPPDLRGLRRDGASFPIEMALNPIDIDGERMLLAGITDISARRESERIARRQQQALEHSNAALIEARQRAEQGTRAKSRFLAGMSHELRTPLNGILGYAQLLDMEGGLSPTQAARVNAMRAAGQHLLDMINNVLDLSEIEAGRVTLRTASIRLRDLALDCLNLLRPGAEARGLAMHLHCAADLPETVVADPTRLRQVLINLLANAVKFTGTGLVELRLRAIRRLGTEERLLIEVVDTGRGIAASRRQDLFKDFERLGRDPNCAIEGAGLGLAISARLASLMGGRIGHADNPGGGSVFGFELPLLTEVAVQPSAAAEPFPNPSEAVPSTAPDCSGIGVMQIAAAPDPTAPVIDLAVFETSASFLSPKAVTSHLAHVTASAEAVLQRLRAREQLDAADGGIIDAVHMLAGCAGLFGFRRLTDSARHFVEQARQIPDRWPEAADELDATLEVSLPEMRRRQATAQGSQLTPGAS